MKTNEWAPNKSLKRDKRGKKPPRPLAFTLGRYE